MKGLSVRQPWADAIANLGKNVENRSWSTLHRGLLAIHAGALWAGVEAQSAVAFNARCNFGDVDVAKPRRSAIVAVVDLVGVCRAAGCDCDCGPWAIRGQVHWLLVNPRPLAELVPCKGRLGLWDLPPEVETAVRMQIDPPVQDMRDCRWCNGMRPADHDCPAGAVGCTTRQPHETPCGECDRCKEVQGIDLAHRADAIEHGPPSDIDHPGMGRSA